MSVAVLVCESHGAHVVVCYTSRTCPLCDETERADEAEKRAAELEAERNAAGG